MIYYLILITAFNKPGNCSELLARCFFLLISDTAFWLANKAVEELLGWHPGSPASSLRVPLLLRPSKGDVTGMGCRQLGKLRSFQQSLAAKQRGFHS